MSTEKDIHVATFTKVKESENRQEAILEQLEEEMEHENDAVVEEENDTAEDLESNEETGESEE